MIDDLEASVVDITLVDKTDIAVLSIVADEQTNIVALDHLGLILNAEVLTGDVAGKEAVPLALGEVVVVEGFELRTEVADERGLIYDVAGILVAKTLELGDEFILQLRFTLVCVRWYGDSLVSCNHGAAVLLNYYVKLVGHIIGAAIVSPAK